MQCPIMPTSIKMRKRCHKRAFVSFYSLNRTAPIGAFHRVKHREEPILFVSRHTIFSYLSHGLFLEYRQKDCGGNQKPECDVCNNGQSVDEIYRKQGTRRESRKEHDEVNPYKSWDLFNIFLQSDSTSAASRKRELLFQSSTTMM